MNKRSGLQEVVVNEERCLGGFCGDGVVQISASTILFSGPTCVRIVWRRFSYRHDSVAKADQDDKTTARS